MCESVYDSPTTLTEICLNFISEHYIDVFEQYNDVDTSKPPKRDKKCIRFHDPDIFLFTELSEKLFEKFTEKDLLDNCTLSLFQGKNTRLSKVKIKDSRITDDGLKVLRDHKVLELQCVNMEHISISRILGCLSDYSLLHLEHLNVSRCTFIDWARHSMMVQLTNLKNLKSLNISYTEFNQQTLRMICEDMQYLEALNISRTCVKNLEPLLLLKDRLISLVASDLQAVNTMGKEIIQLEALKHLDISLVHEPFHNAVHQVICDILENPKKLPNLCYLDISGWPDLIDKEVMETYIDSHSNLAFLGIVFVPIAYEMYLSEPTDYKHIKIAGLGNLDQVLLTLKKYYDRQCYVQSALSHLFRLTSQFTEVRSDVFEVVLPAMAAHPRIFAVQMGATACLYNLTRGEASKLIHSKLLSRATVLTMNAMEYFKDEFQLHKNGLLTLCNDRILQEIPFDRFRCCRIVLDTLCVFNEPNMNRMSVAICSILAAKISTTQTSELGARKRYMMKLLNMVKERVDTKICDITMKFTLSALWNLTDESAKTAEVFLDCGGSELFLKVLQIFRGNAGVETKVLGLLNNIAEVKNLRSRLMVEEFMAELWFILKYPDIDVCYFAAGIVAHLASDGQDCWTVESYSREKLLVGLEEAVSRWEVPECEMVAYRSFKPFFPLLQIEMDYRVQLWAVWAIHHVCTKNSKRYCLKLRYEEGMQLLKELRDQPECHPNVRRIIVEILQTVESMTA